MVLRVPGAYLRRASAEDSISGLCAVFGSSRTGLLQPGRWCWSLLIGYWRSRNACEGAIVLRASSRRPARSPEDGREGGPCLPWDARIRGVVHGVAQENSEWCAGQAIYLASAGAFAVLAAILGHPSTRPTCHRHPATWPHPYEERQPTSPAHRHICGGARNRRHDATPPLGQMTALRRTIWPVPEVGERKRSCGLVQLVPVRPRGVTALAQQRTEVSRGRSASGWRSL